ncbi:MAG: hypothetical protein D6769_03820 [Methanobacteriota archaeon]|nr:MAG: hypothetical protein D6769_03820 [Euryarchaeota archaeon]
MAVKAIVKKFGNNGLHLVVRKRDGFKEGQEVVVMSADESRYEENTKKEELKEIVKEVLEEELDSVLEMKLQALLSHRGGF